MPKTPSVGAIRKKGRGFDGYPEDIAIFDSPDGKGDWRHAKALVECKAPGDRSGLAELQTYMGLEPKVRPGVLTDGSRVTRVYKLPSGDFKAVEGSSLPSPGDNLIQKEDVAPGDMAVPSLDELKGCFTDLLSLIVAGDGRTTREDARLNQLCNLLLLKLQSDSDARAVKGNRVDFQISDTPEDTAREINRLFKRYKADRRDLFSDDEAAEILFDADTVHAVVAELQRRDFVDVKPDTLSLAFQVFRSANLKLGDGQYFTPGRVVRAATRMMCIDSTDKVIEPWDVVTPARASKNIGEPAVVLPGQERAVFTKEILVFRAAGAAPFGNLFVAWALMLPKASAQWGRVVFMQTNREDLGDRWREIVVPVPATRARADELSEPIERYYRELARIRAERDELMRRWM